MFTRNRLIALSITLFLLLSIFGWAAAQPELPAPAAVPQPRGFTYQGNLVLNGQPVSGLTDFQFSLWDAETGGNQIGDTQIEEQLPVGEGRFLAILNRQNEFGVAFIGESRWLEIAVRHPAGSGDYTTLDQRQPLTPTPYAIGLVPGAEIVGNADAYYGLYVNSTASGSDGGIYASGIKTGLYGFSFGDTGVVGDGGLVGVDGFGYDYSGIGVRGVADSGGGVGVSGSSKNNTGVYGNGGEIGVWGAAAGADDVGVYGQADASGSVGVWGTSAANTGVYGVGGAKGVWGTTTEVNTTGVYGEANAAGAIGVWGHSYENTAVYGDSWNGFALWGESTNSTGVYGRSYDLAAYGIFGTGPYIGVGAETTGVSSNRIAVYGDNSNSSTGWAGYFNGKLGASGTINAPASGFTIDHPLDPANKTLSHSTVESPEMKDIYDGVVVTGGDGVAVVQLPDYFQALNQEFRYQLTVVGTFAQAIVSQEISGNKFTIMTDQPNVKVSWQVTGVRHDPYTTWRPLVVEQQKDDEQRGKYWQPQAYGLPPEQAIDYQPAQDASSPGAQSVEPPQSPQASPPTAAPTLSLQPR